MRPPPTGLQSHIGVEFRQGIQISEGLVPRPSSDGPKRHRTRLSRGQFGQGHSIVAVIGQYPWRTMARFKLNVIRERAHSGLAKASVRGE